MGGFVHLHVHSEYSFLDGLNQVKPLVARAKELGFDTLALTDHGVMFGAFEFSYECHGAELKPILGSELYVARRGRKDKQAKEDQKSYHLTVLAKDETGYKNLIKLTSFAHIEGYYYKPRVDHELLEKYHEGLVVLSGCWAGEVERAFLNGKDEEAEKAAKWYKNLFGDDYYLEVMRFGSKEEKWLVPKMVKLGKKLGIKLVATCDVHYLNQDQAKAQEVMWAISDGKRLDDPTRRVMESDQFFLKNEEEMRSLWEDMPGVVDETVAIAKKCNVELKFSGFVLPDVDIPKKYKKNYDKYLKDRTYKEGEARLRRKFTESEGERIDYELGIIAVKKMSQYILLCADFSKWMREHDIFVNTRGSAAGSMVAYSLGVVNANPLKFQLMFERFLNPERPKAPDVDFDIESARRDEVINAAIEKFGWGSVAHIITYDRMRTRAAIRDVGRVLGLPLEVVDKMAKLAPQSGQGTRKASLKEALNQVPELKALVESDERLKELYDYASVLDGIARHRGLHACGVLITPGKIHDHVPVVVDAETGRLVTQYDFRALEELGLLKMDFLGVENLDIIKDAIRIIKENKGVIVDVDKLIDEFNFGDKPTYDLINKLDTLGIFQLESDVMKKTLKIISPQNVLDIGACLALVRPGPNAYQEVYGRRRAGKEKPQYLDPRMEKFLERSYGVLVYQEDLMRCVIELAGMSWAEADTFRKFTGKKIPDILLNQKDDLIKRFLDNGMDKKVADTLFEQFLPFANYAFNEAHSASYSIVTYLTAYLKANFPVEYMAALYKAHLGDQDKLGQISDECRRKGIEILPPDINQSYEDFVIEGEKNIRFGMAGIKGVGRAVVSALVEARGKKPFTSIDDLCSRIDLSKVSKSALEAMAKVGAMDQFGTRAAVLKVLPVAVEKWQDAWKLKKAGQTGFFSSQQEQDNITPTIVPQLDELPEQEKLSYEKELLGTYVSTHPATNLYAVLKSAGVCTVSEALNRRPTTKVKICGYIERLKAITTKSGKGMCFLTVQDHTAEADVTLFPKRFEEKKEELGEGKAIVVVGKIDNRGGRIGMLADKIYILDDEKVNGLKAKIAAANGSCNKPDDKATASESSAESEPETKISPNLSGATVPIKSGQALKIEVPRGATVEQLKDLNDLLRASPGQTKVTIVIPNHKGPRIIEFKHGVLVDDSLTASAESTIPGISLQR